MPSDDETASDSGSCTEGQCSESMGQETIGSQFLSFSYMEASVKHEPTHDTSHSQETTTRSVAASNENRQPFASNIVSLRKIKMTAVALDTVKAVGGEDPPPPPQTVDHFDEKSSTMKSNACKQNAEADSQSQTRDSFKLSACSNCSAAVSAILQPTAFERVHRLCHCCKISAGNVKRDVVNGFDVIVKLRFCTPCFERNGSKFIAEARTAMPLANMKCSGCHRVKPSYDFHKRQQVFRHWEELLGEKHFCFQCLPSGFERAEDSIVPDKLRCATCRKEKCRLSFIKTLKEHALTFDDLDLLRYWIDAGLFVCEKCMIASEYNATRLRCARCKRLLLRVDFSRDQRLLATENDENPGQLGYEPTYTCVDCISSLQRKRNDQGCKASSPKNATNEECISPRRTMCESAETSSEHGISTYDYTSCDRRQRKRRRSSGFQTLKPLAGSQTS